VTAVQDIDGDWVFGREDVRSRDEVLTVGDV
jgi:hypothetical protein